MTLDLLQNLKSIPEEDIIFPHDYHEDILKLFHKEEYIEQVKLASQGQIADSQGQIYGLGTEDTPIFNGMHDASWNIVSATVTACDLVANGTYKHTINLSGGLHHGLSGKASGFCVYNDLAVAIKFIREKYKLRVLYIDTDAHHGDGVQWAFYDDPEVCTFSIHETGRYLFPGTGYVHEHGIGLGHGYTFNLPIDAFTENESWLENFETAIHSIAHYFKPDIIISQHGADSHYYDPLTHLNLTMKSYQKIPEIIHKVAHDVANGKWVAVGGGGYDLWRVVPRAWSLLWLTMTDNLPNDSQLPIEFINKWSKKTTVSLPTTWDDPENLYAPIPRKEEITEVNQETLQKLLHTIKMRSKYM